LIANYEDQSHLWLGEMTVYHSSLHRDSMTAQAPGPNVSHSSNI